MDILSLNHRAHLIDNGLWIFQNKSLSNMQRATWTIALRATLDCTAYCQRRSL